MSGKGDLPGPILARRASAGLWHCAEWLPIADIMGHRDVTTFRRIYRHRLRPVITDPGDFMDGIWGDD